MVRFALNKLAYGLLVLLGVITVVFFIFNLGGDPVENLVSENTSEEVKESIRRKYNLDLSLGKQYLLYLNDISPLSVHADEDSTSRIFFDEMEYSGISIVPLGDDNSIYLKSPYLNRSYISERPVSGVLSDAIPGTAILAVTAIVIALILGILLGVVSARKKDTYVDQVILTFSSIGMSGPSFFMAILIAWIGGVLLYEMVPIPVLPTFIFLGFLVFGVIQRLRKKSAHLSIARYGLIGFGIGVVVWGVGTLILGTQGWTNHYVALPGTGLPMSGSWFGVDVWQGRVIQPQNLILPAITLGVRPLAVVVQLTRSSLLEVMGKDFIRTARAKGLSIRRVIWRHALPNALNPVITAISGWFASMLAGAVFVEFVFGWKGLGLETYSALEKDDLPVVMGAVLVIALIFVVINLLTDIVYGLIDPRVRQSSR